MECLSLHSSTSVRWAARGPSSPLCSLACCDIIAGTSLRLHHLNEIRLGSSVHAVHVLYILLRNHHMLFYVDFNASLIDVSVIISSVSACRDWMSLNICWIGYACLNNMCVKAEFNACLSLYCVRIEWTRWPGSRRSWRRPVLILSETRPSLTPLLLLTPSVSLITLSCRSVCVDVLRLSCVSEASPAVWCCLGRRSLGFWNTAVVCLCLLDVFNLLRACQVFLVLPHILKVICMFFQQNYTADANGDEHPLEDKRWICCLFQNKTDNIPVVSHRKRIMTQSQPIRMFHVNTWKHFCYCIINILLII